MSVRQDRRDKQKRCEDPINFMCGRCNKVQVFVEGYICIHCNYCKPEEEEPAQDAEPANPTP